MSNGVVWSLFLIFEYVPELWYNLCVTGGNAP